MKRFYEATTSDKDILKQQILQRIIYKKAEQLMAWKKAVVIENTTSLDFNFTLPKTTTLTPQTVAEGAVARYQRMGWFSTNGTLEKEQIEILITDESKARMQSDIQTRKSISAATNGLALKKDTEVKNTIVAAAGGTQVSPDKWTDPTADVATQIAMCVGGIIDNTTLYENDMENLQLFYPKGLWGFMETPIVIGEIKQSIRDYLGTKYRMSFNPTQQLTTSAVVMIPGEDTAMHMQYVGKDIPLVEQDRIKGTGDTYLITQLYKTFITPTSEDNAANNRIRTITNVK